MKSGSRKLGAGWVACATLMGLWAAGCGQRTDVPSDVPRHSLDASVEAEVPRAPAPLTMPVPLWQNGAVKGQIDGAHLPADVTLLDLGDDWTPYIFSERSSVTEPLLPNAYRATYLNNAKGIFPTDRQGARVRRDKYLELYGILPTLGLLRERFRDVKKRACDGQFDAEALQKYEGIVGYDNSDRARRYAAQFSGVQKRVQSLLDRQKAENLDALDRKSLKAPDLRLLADYDKMAPAYLAIAAAQDRLKCEGFYEGKGKPLRGALDWSTNEALAEFERMHHLYGWGYMGRATLDALRLSPLDTVREDVLRLLAERAMHAAAFIEDGSVEKGGGVPASFRGKDGKEHAVPNLQKELRDEIVAAFGLQTPESTLAWLDALGDLSGLRLLAVHIPKPPEYHSADMDIAVEIDRGDVWYEFPYDEQGKERGQPVKRRPQITVFANYEGQKIPLARYGTTIGGWRSEFADGSVSWRYKNSPPGPRVWQQVVASPVWLPPQTTPAKDLLLKLPERAGEDPYEVNYYETGPGYASAYGLVAAYHLRYAQKGDGTIDLGGDEGIRTHGSVDYMSIMNRHSHGCHRLHNDIAVRLMSFVLHHRPHRRLGQQRVDYRLPLTHEDHEYLLAIDKGGYVFELEKPIYVEVLKGNIRGRQKTPIEQPLPKFDESAGAYLLPDGGAVKVDREGNLTPIPLPPPPVAPDAG